MLNALGTEVSLYLRKEHVLGEFDSLLKSTLLEQLEQSGIEIRLRCQITDYRS